MRTHQQLMNESVQAKVAFLRNKLASPSSIGATKCQLTPVQKLMVKMAKLQDSVQPA